MSRAPLWIFGYGSLVWRPAFVHREVRPARLRGYLRRFWQASTDHRGVPEQPGRVVTLVAPDHPQLSAAEREAARAEGCWGSAYAVSEVDRESVLETLDHRERGGYSRHFETLWMPDDEGRERAVEGLVYVARPDNPNFVGRESTRVIADRVAGARGPSGENREYVCRLAQSLRAMGVRDDHVFEVVAALHARVGRCAA